MTLQEKVDAFVNDLAQRGVGKYTSAPPLYRLFWRLGIEVPPPHFAGFWSLTMVMGGYFAILWGLFMWLLGWPRKDTPIAITVVTALFAGLLFGVIMAALYRRRAQKLALPRWEDYLASQVANGLRTNEADQAVTGTRSSYSPF